MGCRVEQAHNGDVLDVHIFDTKEAAEHYVKIARCYSFDRHESWVGTPGVDFYQGPDREDRASVHRYQGTWRANFWRRP
jgi:hypothetical protein